MFPSSFSASIRAIYRGSSLCTRRHFLAINTARWSGRLLDNIVYNSQLMNLNIKVGRNAISYEYMVSVRNSDRSELMHHQTSRPM